MSAAPTPAAIDRPAVKDSRAASSSTVPCAGGSVPAASVAAASESRACNAVAAGIACGTVMLR
jgi:hypothetical protein